MKIFKKRIINLKKTQKKFILMKKIKIIKKKKTMKKRRDIIIMIKTKKLKVKLDNSVN
jgi:hypothetical protein